MSKPVTAPELTAAQLENEAKKLGLDKMHDGFFSKEEKAKDDTYCNVFDKEKKNNEEAKKLCSTFVYFLEKISKEKKSEHDKYCSYLRYWLYDKIGAMHTDHSKKIDEKVFVNDLIEAGKKTIRDKLRITCDLPSIKDVSVNDLKYRKLSYIYLKNHDVIEKGIKSIDKSKCDTYMKYLNNINLLYKSYKTHCWTGFFGGVFGPSYADCSSSSSSKYDPSKLITALNGCKDKASRGSGGSGLVSWLFGWGSSSESSSRGKDSPGPGNAKTIDAAGEKGQGASKTLAGSKDAPGLTRSTTAVGQVSSGGSARPVVAAAASGDSPSNLESESDKMGSNFIRNIIMGTAILGTIFFLFYYNMSSRLKSSFPKRKRKKKIFEHNYYEEYEKEFEKYDSEDMTLASQSDQYYLNYQPERDYDY
ncbi:VIR protein [Plasmodium vivax]|uniref:VIR protein n=1 Tax=Plasmodium vivax TaxID=5855 RepID=A0A1G4E160_PLAVI|nr:VIR protein [Plasmodium vivax]